MVRYGKDIGGNSYEIWICDIQQLDLFFDHVVYANDRGPVRIVYNKNGLKRNEFWGTDNMAHRLDGPSEIWYDDDGNVSVCCFLLCGEQYHFEDWIKIVKDKISEKRYEQLKLQYGE